MLSKAGAESMPGVCRVLMLQCCGDVPGQYIACMNAIFSAQRLDVAIDGILLTSASSSFMEQARCTLAVCAVAARLSCQHTTCLVATASAW